MLRRLTSGHIVWETNHGACGSLSPSVIESLLSWTQRRFFSKEAGGLLLGFIDTETQGLLVENLTIPGSGDHRTRTSFYRSDRHQREAEQWNLKTQGRGTQLGLWHTHPERHPTPSSTDLNDCANVLRNGKFESNGFLYLIVGTKTIGFWYVSYGFPIYYVGHFKP